MQMMSFSAASKILGVHPGKLVLWERQKRFASITIGGGYKRISEQDVLMLQAQQQNAAPTPKAGPARSHPREYRTVEPTPVEPAPLANPSWMDDSLASWLN